MLFSSCWYKTYAILTEEKLVKITVDLNSLWNDLLASFCAYNRWFVFDTETKDLVTVHTDGNEQLSVMRYSPGLRAFICWGKKKALKFFIKLGVGLF